MTDLYVIKYNDRICAVSEKVNIEKWIKFRKHHLDNFAIEKVHRSMYMKYSNMTHDFNYRLHEIYPYVFTIHEIEFIRQYLYTIVQNVKLAQTVLDKTCDVLRDKEEIEALETFTNKIYDSIVYPVDCMGLDDVLYFLSSYNIINILSIMYEKYNYWGLFSDGKNDKCRKSGEK